MLGRPSGYQLKRIHFVLAKNPDAHSINASDLGLIPLNDPVENTMGRKSGKATGKEAPRRELFKEEDLAMTWIKMRRVGSGLCNLGNTCFMNSVLQCLLHTAPLAELLLSGRPLASTAAPSNGFDPIAMTRQLLQESLSSRRDYVSPQFHARSLKRINRSFRMGRQEDAHEYLIALLDAMHERSIAGIIPKPPPDVEFTSFVYRIFGGRIRSQVKCTQCGYESNTYDPFLDLSLEINHANSVQRALQRFTAGEALDGANKYKCPKQNRGVRAIKRITIEDAPNVLIVQLKRFEFSLSGRKISRPVTFDEELDLGPFMSRRPPVPALYDLYGVLVHQGHSMHSGHYFCFLKGAGTGEWHKFDDTRVHATSARNVLGQLPYILFYIRRTAATATAALPKQPAALAESRSAAQRERDRALQPATLNSKQPVVLKRGAQGMLVEYEDAGDAIVARAKAKAKRMRQEHEAPDDGPRREKVQAPVARSKSSLPPATLDSDEDQEPAARKGKRAKQHAADDGDVNRPSALLRHRHNGPLSPVGIVPPTLGRRGKRLAEQKMLLSFRLANGNGATPPKRRRIVAARVESPVEDSSPSQRGDDASLGSAVSAPDWPPVKARAAPPTQVATQARKTDKSAVKEHLKGPGAHSLGVDAWEEAEAEDVRRHNHLLRRDVPKRRKVDEYDAEYDSGKVKKVRDKSRPNGRVDSRAFDAAGQTGRKAEALREVQFRGKKKQRQLRRS